MGATQDRLKSVEKDLGNIRDRLSELQADPDKFENPDWELRKTRRELDQLQAKQIELLEDLGHSNGNGNGGGSWDLEELHDPRIKSFLEEIAASGAPFNRLPLGKAIGARDLAEHLGTIAKADVAVGTGARRGEFGGISQQPRRALTLLDLVTTAPMSGSAVPYLQESGSFDTATEVTEGVAKPEAAAAYADAQADAATIAHWLKLRKQSLADVDGLQTAIEGRLRYGVLRRLEGQIVAGDGATPNIRGILNTSGIQTQAFVAGPIVDQLVRGATKVFTAGGIANGALVNPTDLETALLAKTSGSGEFLGAPAFGGMFGLEWEARTIPSTAVAAGRAIVGDFARGCTLFVREGVNVLVSDSDQDDFIKNRVTLLGEMRAALAVWAPSLFVDVDLAA